MQGLSPLEREVAALVAEGLANADIALKLGLSRSTTKDYVANACHKLGVSGRTALGVWWVTKGKSA
jgi:DNA-binding CsgD family transcriptional regulator